MKTIGDKISEILKTKDMKQADLARRTGISTGLISAIINNQRTSVMVDTLQKIAKALSVPPAYFLEEDDTLSTPDILSSLSSLEQNLVSGAGNLPWMFSVGLAKQEPELALQGKTLPPDSEPKARNPDLPSAEKWAKLRKLSKEAKEKGLPLDKVWQIINMIEE